MFQAHSIVAQSIIIVQSVRNMKGMSTSSHLQLVSQDAAQHVVHLDLQQPHGSFSILLRWV